MEMIAAFEYINQFVSNAPFLYLKVFWRFQGVEKGCIGSTIPLRFSIVQIQVVSYLTTWFSG